MTKTGLDMAQLLLNNKIRSEFPSASGKGTWLIIKPLGQVIRRVIIRAEISSKLEHLLFSLFVG
jgi:hypothetical protein